MRSSICWILGVAFFASLPLCSAQAELVSVQVRESVVRAKPLFYSQGVMTLRHGDQLEKLSVDSSGWTKVRVKGIEGFIPSSSITTDVIVLSAKKIKGVKADPSDVVLAGKGFNKEVEQEYQKRDSSARFDYVNRVESAARISRGEMPEFLKNGGLNRG